MTQRQFAIVIVLASLFGFLGGTISMALQGRFFVVWKQPDGVKARGFQVATGGAVQAELIQTGEAYGLDPQLRFFDAQGKTRASLGLLKGKHPRLDLVGDMRSVSVSLDGHGSPSSNEPTLTFIGSDGTIKAVLELDLSKTTPTLRLTDDEGKVVWQAP